MDGFTCFREKQEIDFAPFQLFAISGPTGAGKSSVLDAMLFALYGLVPRVGKGCKELVSLGRDRMSVVFDFELGGKRYRVARSARRKGAATALLEEVHADGETPIADGIRDVDARIERLVGLDFAAFTQAVVLPQGEFATFLKSVPGERRKILTELLRLQIYERMRREAADRAQQIAIDLTARRRQLEQDYIDATPDALASVQKQHNVARSRGEQLAKEVSAATEIVAQLRGLETIASELGQKKIELQQLAKREPEIRALEEHLEASRRAGPIVPLLEAATSATNAAAEQHKRADAARKTEQSARQGWQRAQNRLGDAEGAAKEIPSIEERIRKLDELKGLLEARDRTQVRLEKLQEQQRKAAGDLAEAEAAKEAAATDAKKKAAAADQARRDQATLSFDAGFAKRLEGALEACASLAGQRKVLADTRATLVSAESGLEKAKSQLARAKTAAEAARAGLAKAESTLRDAHAARDHAQRAEAVHVLRAGLHAGDACPVCERPVDKLPRAIKAGRLATLEEMLGKAQTARDGAQQESNEASAQEAGAKERVTTSEQAVREARERAVVALGELSRADRDLEEAFGASASKGKGPIEVRVLAAAREMVVLREKSVALADACAVAEKAAEKARAFVERKEALWLGAVEKERGVRQQAAEAERELGELSTGIRTTTEHPDPLREREELANKNSDLRDDLEKARAAERKTATEVTGAEARSRELRDSAARATESAEQAAAHAEDAARGAGFPDGAAARTATLKRAVENAHAESIRSWSEARSVTAHRYDELVTVFAGRQAELASLPGAVERLGELSAQREAAVRDEASLAERMAQLAEKVEIAARLRRELEDSDSRHRVYDQLSDDLRGDRFQAFLLDQTFKDLVAGASVRLQKLTGRYTLDFREDAFDVLDGDNGGERRRAETLSGGETFLASLALALELSEQVQRAAGSVPLGSLFIDEGFGSLDPETLDTVAGAVESLQAGGRMVGIITHIAELTERLPARLVVEKTAAGAKVSVQG